MSKQTIPTSDEAWDARELGAAEEFAHVAAEEITAGIDEASGTQLISIRLRQSSIDDLKAIALINKNIGYQTLIKQILQRFIECEKKAAWNQIVADTISKNTKEQRQIAAKQKPKPREKSRKVA